MTTEETKPVEREAVEAFQSWAMGKQSGIPFPYVALELDKVSFAPIKFKDDLTQAFFVVWNAAWQASADAALERAAALLEEEVDEEGGYPNGVLSLARSLAEQIRALKGSR